jgi:hypothetical protein
MGSPMPIGAGEFGAEEERPSLPLWKSGPPTVQGPKRGLEEGIPAAVYDPIADRLPTFWSFLPPALNP